MPRSLEEVIEEIVRDVIRSGEVFRNGVVTHVEPPADPDGYYVYTINDGATSRTMTATQSGLANGDDGPMVDQEDPFFMGKFHRG